jgi:N-acetylglucosaminyldiphosphoundecaprenol N-acetyl-beta-D-mannosaminyltransferase
VLGVAVDAITAEEVIDRVDDAIETGTRLIVGHHNLHSAYLSRQSEGMRRFYERADLVYVDGMPLVLADRFASRRLERCHRATLLDWIDPLLARGDERGWSVHLLGGTSAVVEAAATHFAARHRGVRFTSHHGYFGDDDEAEREVLAELVAVQPDLLLVGMGMPRQEEWLGRRFDALEATVAISIGGLFDYFAGAQKTPPRWMGKVGLEWLARLVADPRRLGRRYVVEPVLLANELLAERVRVRR